MFVGNEFETILKNRSGSTVVTIGCTTNSQPRLLHGRCARLCRHIHGKDHNAALKRIERFADLVDSSELINLWPK